MHPKAIERFVASYRKRGGKVDLALYEGEGGGFIRDPASKAAPLAMQRISISCTPGLAEARPSEAAAARTV